MAVLTNAASNKAKAVMGDPIAISIGSKLVRPAEPFVQAVLFGANMSFATPMAYKTNLLVMNAEEYTFNDFLRVGIPLGCDSLGDIVLAPTNPVLVLIVGDTLKLKI